MFMRAVLKAHSVTDRLVVVADSFEGLPLPDVERVSGGQGLPSARVGDYLSVPLEEVQANFDRHGLLDDQVRFVKGWFRDTMPTLSDHRWARHQAGRRHVRVHDARCSSTSIRTCLPAAT